MSDVPPGLVAMPCRETMPSKSALALTRLASELPDGARIEGYPTGSTIANNRNHAVRQLLSDDALEWVLHLDSDMTPPGDVVQRLWATAEAEGADAVSAAMVQRSPPHHVTGGRVPRRATPRNPLAPYTTDPDVELAMFSADAVAAAGSPFPIDVAGTGCLLVRRHVYEELGAPWFVAMPDGCGSDYNSTLRMTAAGFRIVLDPDIRVGHVTSYAIGLHEVVPIHRDLEFSNTLADPDG